MTAPDPSWGPNTRAVHLPDAPVPEQHPTGLPVYRTATYRFATSGEYADVLGGVEPGYSYSRYANPTSDAFATAVAVLEGGERGVPFASGMAAITTVLLALLSTGDHVVAPVEAYGGTYGFLDTFARRLGVETTFVRAGDPQLVADAIRPNTKLVWAETIANPTTTVADLPALAGIAHAAGAFLVVDSTFATPVLCRPLELGADLVVHSVTKYLAGHSDVIAGVAVGGGELAERVWLARVSLGGSLSPDDAWIAYRGLATLPLRMERHSASAALIAAELEGHPRLSRVDHPSLPSSPDHELARRQFAGGMGGGVLTIHVRGGVPAGQGFCDNLQLALNETSLGGVQSRVSHVATTTHRQLDEAALAQARLDGGSVRVSIGLEDPDDLLADFRRALDAL